jgi:hypothetical protein
MAFKQHKEFTNEHLCTEFRLRSTRTVGGLSEVEARWRKIFLQVPKHCSPYEKVFK